MLALPPFTGKPVIILSAKEPMSETSDLARDANAKRVDIVRLHPGAKQVWVDSGHAIPLEQPEAITDAIREVLASARAHASIHAGGSRGRKFMRRALRLAFVGS